MQTDEKPLRVQVAEALGCSVRNVSDWGECGCKRDRNGNAPHADPDEPMDSLLPYGESSPGGWACTGILAERFKFGLLPPRNGIARAGIPADALWVARTWAASKNEPDVVARGASLCEAIARCVVALAAAGRLPK